MTSLARFAASALFCGSLGTAAVAGMFPGNALAAEHYYRNDVTVRTGPPDKFLIEVPEAAAMHGGYFKVITDDAGRVTRVLFLVDGKVAGDTVYQYAGGGSLPSVAQTYKQGALTGTTKVTRDASGRTTRTDYFTAQGTPTGHTVIKYVADHAELANYTADDHPRWHSEQYFNADGVEIRSAMHQENDSASVETTYDPQRGIEKSQKQFRNGQLQVSLVNSYDDDDDITRQDLYDEKGRWYGAKVYEHNLLVKKLYKFSDGHTEQTIIKYDSNRWIESAQFSHDEKLICTLTQEHLPDGTIKRTIALGPDGSLLAEYPNLSVTEVDRHGHPPNSTAGTIHKTGNWW